MEINEINEINEITRSSGYRAFKYGILSILPIIIGFILIILFNIPKSIIAIIGSIGSGAMLSTISYGLMVESFSLAGRIIPLLGFSIGALFFTIAYWLISKYNTSSSSATGSATGWGLTLGSLLDGIPESIALGINIATGNNLGMILLIGIILTNFPETALATYDLKNNGMTTTNIVLLWSFISIIIFLLVLLGYIIKISKEVNALFQSFASGILFSMVLITMIPQIFSEIGMGISIPIVIGFLIIYFLSIKDVKTSKIIN